MFESGLIEETKELSRNMVRRPGRWRLSDTSRQCNSFAAEVTREQAIQAAQQAHRNYAKRQMTWFRREPDVTWLKGFGDDPRIQQEALLAVDSMGVGQLPSR